MASLMSSDSELILLPIISNPEVLSHPFGSLNTYLSNQPTKSIKSIDQSVKTKIFVGVAEGRGKPRSFSK